MQPQRRGPHLHLGHGRRMGTEVGRSLFWEPGARPLKGLSGVADLGTGNFRLGPEALGFPTGGGCGPGV